MLTIKEAFLTENIYYQRAQRITVKKLVLHSVGVGQPSAAVFLKNWNKPTYTRACVHAFIDANNGVVYQTMPWDWLAPHSGGSWLNNNSIGVEMCESSYIKYIGTSDRFTIINHAAALAHAKVTYMSAVELFAYLCLRFNLNPMEDILSHNEGRLQGLASPHSDPEHYWDQLGTGYTMDGFRKDVANAMNGKVTVTVKESTEAKKVIDLALAEVGYLEKGSNADLDSKTDNAGRANYTKYARDLDAIEGFYNGKKQAQPWCAVFVDDMFVMAYGVENAKAMTHHSPLGARCDYAAKGYQDAGAWYTTPKAGDEIFFRSASYNYAHTGLVVEVTDSEVITVEGNTGNGSGVIPNGGAVCKKAYKLDNGDIVGYGRPNYSNKEDEEMFPTLKKGSEGDYVKALQKMLEATGFSCGKAGIDGDFGTGTEAAVEKFQIEYGLTADKIVGPVTWTALVNAPNKEGDDQLQTELTSVKTSADMLCARVEEAVKIFRTGNGNE